MLENSVTFIKYCGTQTVSSPGTAWLGWWADAPPAGGLVFCSHRDYFVVTRKLHCPLSGLVTVSQLHRDPKLTAVYRDSLTLAPLGQGRCKKRGTATPLLRRGRLPAPNYCSASLTIRRGVRFKGLQASGYELAT
jgi:hypothetical protein